MAWPTRPGRIGKMEEIEQGVTGAKRPPQPQTARARLTAVRAALRGELEARGYRVASDTLSLRDELYVRGDNDLARALFEFKATAEEALTTMYQGSWVEGMPPRFVVMPASEKDARELDVLGQMRIQVLFFERTGEEVDFLGIEEALAVIRPPA